MDQLLIIIATGLYVGKLPFLPGVWGSALAMLFCFYCKKLPILFYLIITAGLFFMGMITAELAEGALAEIDASPIVIDEILGVFIALVLVPYHRIVWLAGFLMFVIIDSLKPFPASWVELNIQGGLGIMLDDVVAGLYTLTLLRISTYLFNKLKKSY